MMIGISGKSTATSSIGIGWPYFRRTPPPPGMPVPMPLCPVWNSTGMPGGGGVRLKYGHPMPIDDVAVDFPEMPIIMAHPSFPWQDEAISICLHKPTVYIDLSGWSPKYFSPTLVQYANTLLKHKVLFGSDYPLLTPDRWLADLEKTAIREDVRPLILRENAIKLFGLE